MSLYAYKQFLVIFVINLISSGLISLIVLLLLCFGIWNLICRIVHLLYFFHVFGNILRFHYFDKINIINFHRHIFSCFPIIAVKSSTMKSNIVPMYAFAYSLQIYRPRKESIESNFQNKISILLINDNINNMNFGYYFI